MFYVYFFLFAFGALAIRDPVVLWVIGCCHMSEPDVGNR